MMKTSLCSSSGLGSVLISNLKVAQRRGAIAGQPSVTLRL